MTTLLFPAACWRAVSTRAMRAVVLPGLLALGGAFLFSPAAWAGDGEVSGFFGGITLNGGLGTHPMGGGAAAYGIGEHLHVFGEVNHSTILSVSDSGVTGNAGLTNFGGGLDYTFGSSTSKFRPYALIAFGAGHFTASAESVSISIGNAFYTGFGGGARLYIGDHWGIKPEVRIQRYISSTLGGTAALYTVGVFYQFGN